MKETGLYKIRIAEDCAVRLLQADALGKLPFNDKSFVRLISEPLGIYLYHLTQKPKRARGLLLSDAAQPIISFHHCSCYILKLNILQQLL